MKFVLVAVVALLAVSTAFAVQPLAESEYEFLFTKWLSQHSVQYSTTAETFSRYTVWKNNLDYIRNHNDHSNKTHKLAMNAFGDLTNDEFRERFNGYFDIDNSFLRSKNVVDLSASAVPDTVDWAKAGKVTPVKDQGQCGSCWAFSATGSVEAAYAIENNADPLSISEQELVDCSSAQGNQGCNGGLMDQAFQYIISNKGLCAETAYPYKATDGTCQSSKCTATVTITAYTDVPTQSEDALKAAVAQQPVFVAVDAGGLDWQFYSSGVMSDACGTELDHGVLAAGYGTLNGQDYWQVKNSWGASWGQQGYVFLKRESGTGKPGECGITLAASYPTGAKKA